MSYYSITRSNVTVSSTANDLITIVPAAGRMIQLIEFSVAGTGTASSAAEIDLYNITTVGTTGSGGITPIPLNPGYSPASTTTVSTTWAGQPVVGAIPTIPLAVNGNGGIYRWVARPDEVILAVGGVAAALGWSIRASLAPATSYTINVVWSENPF